MIVLFVINQLRLANDQHTLPDAKTRGVEAS
jgi:hypothetical protein